MRKALGEIPRVTESVSFTDLFRTDSATDARVIKDPATLRHLFEQVPGLDFEPAASAKAEEGPKSEAVSKQASQIEDQNQEPTPQREVIFTC